MISKNQIKRVKSLHRKKERDEFKLFIAEGVKLVTELLSFAPEKIKELFITAEFAGEHRDLLNSKLVNPIIVTEEELKQISLLSAPNKALAVCSYFHADPPEFNFDKNFSFYLDDIRDPGNLGTIIRLADWYGIEQVFCSESTVDFYNPKVIQSTMGAFLRVNCVYAPLKDIILSGRVKNVYGAVLNGSDLYSSSLSPGLIVIGNESNGIADENLKFINHLITIPAHRTNGTESLNAAIASAIIASEFYRRVNYK